MRRSIIYWGIVLGCWAGSLGNVLVQGQCALCRASVENTIDGEEQKEKLVQGLNRGIVYLLLVPYLSLGVVAWVWYRQHKRLRERA